MMWVSIILISSLHYDSAIEKEHKFEGFHQVETLCSLVLRGVAMSSQWVLYDHKEEKGFK